MTLLAASIVNTHELVPVHAPPVQPEKVEPVLGVAFRVTLVPELKEALQAIPQFMVGDAGIVDTTVPVPVLLINSGYSTAVICCVSTVDVLAWLPPSPA